MRALIFQKKSEEAMRAAAEWKPSARKVSPSPPREEGRKQGTPFKRVQDGEWMHEVGRLSEVDNSYEARFGEGGYGAKANEKLRTVRGKDFRHEKTKRKRGTYRGGVIDTGMGTSFKFANSDDEQ